MKLCYNINFNSLGESDMKSILDEIGLEYSESGNKFFIEEFCLQINVNDAYLDSDKFIEPRSQFDEMNSNLEKGIRTLNFYVHELIANRDLVKSMIASRTNNSSNKIYARNCEIVELPYKVAKEFCDKNHLAGAANGKIYLGLGYNGKLVSVMSFGIPRFSKKYNYELIRFCSVQNTNVIGAASKLFKYFNNNYLKNGESVTTYANRRFSEGDMYRQLGFTEVNNSSPNYFYIRENETPKMRYECQKHKLTKLLEIFDSNKTEYENMRANNYYRQYDCGNYVFEYIKN